MARSSVLLPHPFGPMITVKLPAGMSRLSRPAPRADRRRRETRPAGVTRSGSRPPAAVVAASLVTVRLPCASAIAHGARPRHGLAGSTASGAQARAIGLVDASENASRSPSPIRTVTVGPVCLRASRSPGQVGPVRFAPSAAPRRPARWGSRAGSPSASRPPVGTFTPPRRR